MCLGCLLAPRRAAPLAAFPITLPDFWGPLALQAGSSKYVAWGGCPFFFFPFFWGGGRVQPESNTKAGIGAARVQAVQAHICPHTLPHTPGLAGGWPVCWCLLAPLALISLCFPEAAPTSGTAEPRTARQPRPQGGAGKSRIQTCASFLLPTPSPKIYLVQEGGCSESK